MSIREKKVKIIKERGGDHVPFVAYKNRLLLNKRTIRAASSANCGIIIYDQNTYISVLFYCNKWRRFIVEKFSNPA